VKALIVHAKRLTVRKPSKRGLGTKTFAGLFDFFGEEVLLGLFIGSI
jgi:hypothetical protein